MHAKVLKALHPKQQHRLSRALKGSIALFTESAGRERNKLWHATIRFVSFLSVAVSFPNLRRHEEQCDFLWINPECVKLHHGNSVLFSCVTSCFENVKKKETRSSELYNDHVAFQTDRTKIIRPSCSFLLIWRVGVTVVADWRNLSLTETTPATHGFGSAAAGKPRTRRRWGRFVDHSLVISLTFSHPSYICCNSFK